MTSSRPYLVRAIYQWICDNGLTPYLLVDATAEDCMVPVEHIQDGKIILNIAPMAVSGLVLGDEAVTFSARFSGRSESIYAPIEAVLAIYARENGQGMMFADDEEPATRPARQQGDESGEDETDPDPDKPTPTPPRPKLHVVK
ncbi:MAG TPA: ClpXP protease specificity-enhancing factor [Thiotrichales bacterium]|nr:ClpXP protease specificity-enhancing factor [Thiotrichales bacterium]